MGARAATSRFLKWLIKKLLFLTMPAFPWIAWVNRKVDANYPSYDEALREWQGRLAKANGDQREVVKIVYQQSRDRFTGLEAKAVGLLTAIAILAAAASVACAGETASALVGAIALVFLVSAGTACCWGVLHPRPRHILRLTDIDSSTHGVAEMAASAKAAEPQALRFANMITSVNYDLLRALVATAIALGLFASEHSINSQLPGSPITTVTTTSLPHT